MASRRKRIEGKLGAIIFAYAERKLAKRGPLEAERLGARLGMLAWRIDRKHRERTISNLELAMPELSEVERLEIAQEVFRHFGRTAADFIRADVRTREEVLASVEVVGLEHVDAARALGKGILSVTGHFGNWERSAHWMALQGHPLTVVARDADDTAIDVGMRKKRQAQGMNVLSRGNTVRQILKVLKEGKMVAILADQNSDEAFVPFFGKPCGTVLGPAVLHLRTGAPILPTFCARVGPDRYQTIVRPALEVPSEQRTPEGIMAALHAELESAIRKHPSQWLWMHDRWKSARRAGLL